MFCFFLLLAWRNSPVWRILQNWIQVWSVRKDRVKPHQGRTEWSFWLCSRTNTCRSRIDWSWGEEVKGWIGLWVPRIRCFNRMDETIILFHAGFKRYRKRQTQWLSQIVLSLYLVMDGCVRSENKNRQTLHGGVQDRGIYNDYEPLRLLNIFSADDEAAIGETAVQKQGRHIILLFKRNQERSFPHRSNINSYIMLQKIKNEWSIGFVSSWFCFGRSRIPRYRLSIDAERC